MRRARRPTSLESPADRNESSRHSPQVPAPQVRRKRPRKRLESVSALSIVLLLTSVTFRSCDAVRSYRRFGAESLFAVRTAVFHTTATAGFTPTPVVAVATLHDT